MSGLDDLPDESVPEDDSEKGPYAYTQRVNPNDVVTVGSGFINDIKRHERSGDAPPLFFVRCGLICGSVKGGDGAWTGRIQNVDLLCGTFLAPFVESLAGQAHLLKGVRFSFAIRNLFFSPTVIDGVGHLDSKGVLERISVGSDIKPG